MKSDPWVLGISASHNGAACLLKGDEVVVAIQEERLTRRKREFIYGAKPSMAIRYCLDAAGIRPADLSMVVNCVTGSARTPQQDVKRNPDLRPTLNRIPTLTIAHHLGHAVAALATSGFEEAAVLVIDGAGSPFEDLSEDERAVCLGGGEGLETISLYTAARGAGLRPVEKHLGTWVGEDRARMPRFGSLGGMYAAAAAQIFGDISEAGKVMGLAPYGRPEIPVEEFFTLSQGEFVFSDRVLKRFTGDERWPRRETEYENLAASVQVALEGALLYLVEHLYELCPSVNLCYTGGVALNSVANERIIGESSFKKVFITPAAEDSGAAIGAAYYGLWQLTDRSQRRKMIHDATGREYGTAAVDAAIEKIPGIEVVEAEDVVAEAAGLLSEGHILGWFQGRSELGPRALGQRSILCDPRRPDGKEILNSRVKHREGFRPFAPVVTLEEAPAWFELDGKDPESPFMLRICKFREGQGERVPAVVHVDGTGRFQTVTREANGRLYELVRRFQERTGVPIVLNTSFNVMGEPIIETPEDALLCFQSTGIDYCVLQNRLVKKRLNVLFGGAGVYWLDRVRGELTAADEKALRADGSTPTPPRPLRDYTGRFEHVRHGELDVVLEDGRLKGILKGGLEVFVHHVDGDIFGVGQGPMSGARMTFLTNGGGVVDAVAWGTGLAWQATVFTRAPEALDEPTARVPTGRYSGPAGEMTVAAVEGGRLTATVPGQRVWELTPQRGGGFGLRWLPGYHIEFQAGDAGRAASVVVTQPEGVFELERVAR
jgi:carbamoyltransferase